MGSDMDEFDYDVCLSFAGEQRQYVEKVAMSLVGRGIRVFYDAYERASLWGKDLYTHLDFVYREAATYCVIFVSESYATKIWTNHELRSAQARAVAENEEYILPARFDNTELPGLRPTIAYVDLTDLTPDELGGLVAEKLRMVADKKKEDGPAGIGQPGHDTQARDQMLKRIDRLIENIATPSPKFASESELIALGWEAASAIVRTIIEVAPRGTHDDGERRLTTKSKRLLTRTRRILKEMMPESGRVLHQTLLEKISEGDEDTVSRLIWYTNSDVAIKDYTVTLSELISSDRFPELTMQIATDLLGKHHIPHADINLIGKTFLRPHLTFSDLLQGQDFSGSTFTHAWFHSANLSACDFSRVKFNEGSFPRTRFDNSSFREACFEGYHIYVPGVSFVQCDFTNCKFGRIYAEYRKPVPSPEDRFSFEAAKLHGAVFRGADLRGTDFTNCIGFSDILDFSDTNLYGAIGLTDEQLDTARRKGALIKGP